MIILRKFSDEQNIKLQGVVFDKSTKRYLYQCINMKDSCKISKIFYHDTLYFNINSIVDIPTSITTSKSTNFLKEHMDLLKKYNDYERIIAVNARSHKRSLYNKHTKHKKSR